MPTCQSSGCFVASHAKDAKAAKNANKVSCNDALFDMASAIADSFAKQCLKFYICMGTLLGAVRDHSIIDWTADVDFCVDSKVCRTILKNYDTMFPGNKVFADGQANLRVCPNFGGQPKYNWDMNYHAPYMDLYETEGGQN